MASGKSTLGRAAAERLGWKFLDTDKILEELHGCTAGELFSRRGEEFFRRSEGEVLSKALCEKGNLILALGGGTVKSTKNRKLLKERAKVVWLDTSIDIVMSELGNSDRPLVKGKTRCEVEALYEERKPLYRAAADYVFTINSTDYGKVVEDLAALVRTIPSL